ncbi:hypothetical protein JTB14_018400 [Gonioctena quinquepunctata]|nr:hypothetical protein JTB14_018400 [Gonioctena quinquepunctata]
MISNGTGANIPQKTYGEKIKYPSEKFASLEKFNWSIYIQYVRGEIDGCKKLIRRELERSNGRNEFALFKQGKIYREEGKLQEALNSFQACLRLNPENIENLKEAGKCLNHITTFENMLSKLSKRMTVIEKLSKENADLEVMVGQLTTRIGNIEQQARLNNIEIQGVPEKSNENILQILILSYWPTYPVRDSALPYQLSS